MFKENEEGQTHFCLACEAHGQGLKHTCGIEQGDKEWNKNKLEKAKAFVNLLQEQGEVPKPKEPVDLGNCGICGEYYNKRSGAYDDITNKGMICIKCYNNQPKETLGWEIELKGWTDLSIDYKEDMSNEQAFINMKRFITRLLKEKESTIKKELVERLEAGKRFGGDITTTMLVNGHLDKIINLIKP